MLAETLGKRTRDARLYAGYTQEELARRVRVSQTAIHKLESGHSKSTRQTVQIAVACGVNPVWLGTGQGEMTNDSHQLAETSNKTMLACTANMANKVPIYSWQNVAGNNEVQVIEGWAPVSRQVGEDAYALVVQNDMMEPDFTVGDTIIIDPEVLPNNNRFVVARRKGADEPMLRKIIHDGDKKWLESTDKRFPPEVFSDLGFYILGVVVSKTKDY